MLGFRSQALSSVATNKTLAAILLSAALSLMPLPSAADEAETKRQLEVIATALVPNLPSGKKVVLKPISPEDSGLPADFLGKLTSDLEAALLVASEFEIDLINRQTTEELWAEAIEFNNADFEALHAASGADVALMLTARATEAGVEIALTAYSLDAADAGKVLASTGSTVLALDMQQNVGVDVNSLNDQMAQVLSEIEKVGQTGGLISDSNTYAEYYHNARILQQRGETDLAMQAYEQALAEGYLFVDPLLDLLDLSNARYGADGTKIYFEKKIQLKIPKELSRIGDVVLGGDLMALVQPILDGEVTFSPLLAIWLQSTYMNWNEMDTLTVGKARTKAAELISKDYKSGKLQSFYVDKIRGASVGESATQTFDSMMQSGQLMVDWNETSRTSTYFARVGPDDRRPYMRGFDIQDRVDMTQPITFCASEYEEDATCRDIDPWLNVFTNSDSHWFGFNSGTAMDWTFGMHCAVSVSYTDLNGFKVTSPVLVNHEQREEYAPIDLDKVIECAGEHYRPRG